MSFTATVENDTIKLPPGLHLPDGMMVSVAAVESPRPADPEPRGTFAGRYQKYVGIADDLPPDFAQNHDHYLHGAPKRA